MSEIAKAMVYKFPSHVKHGIVYQDKSLPQQKLRRVNRDLIGTTESDSTADNKSPKNHKTPTKDAGGVKRKASSPYLAKTTFRPNINPPPPVPEGYESATSSNNTTKRKSLIFADDKAPKSTLADLLGFPKDKGLNRANFKKKTQTLTTTIREAGNVPPPPPSSTITRYVFNLLILQCQVNFTKS